MINDKELKHSDDESTYHISSSQHHAIEGISNLDNQTLNLKPFKNNNHPTIRLDLPGN
ncbi:MAG: hypothetical protein MJE63_24410 [Proteobacteria bacterium]|nr:hypothetical protein [Pseudomonadota bacterium]